MFVKKNALQWAIVFIFFFIIMGSIWTPSAQAQYWTALPPYNFLWPLWSPALSPANPLTGLPTPLVSQLSNNTVLPAQPVVVLDPSQEYPISVYNIPPEYGGGLTYFHPLYGLNFWPPPNMIDPLTGLPIPLSLPLGFQLISPLDPEAHGSVVTQGNLAYVNQYPNVPLSALLAVEDIWGLRPVSLSLHIEDALEGVPVNKVVGDTDGPTYYTRLEIVAKLFSFGPLPMDDVPVILTIPGNLFGSPVNTWVRDSNGGALTSVPYVNLGGGRYRVTTDLSPLIILPGIVISYRKQIVWRFLIPNSTLPQNVTVSAYVGIPYTAPMKTGTIRILAPGNVRSLIIANRRLLYDNYNSWHVTRLLQRLFTEAQGWPASHTPRAVIYYVERYDSRALNWDNTAVDYTNETTANVAANAIDDLIEDWHEDATNYFEIFIPLVGTIRIPVAWPNYLLIVGNDDTIPFYRYNDPSNDEGIDRVSWACLHGWCVDSATNPSIHATDEDYFFTDNPYADLYGGTDWQTGDVELWTGRLLGESAADMLSMLEEGVDRNNGRRGGVVMASVDGWELGLEPDDSRPGEVADLYDVTNLFRNKGFAVRNDDNPAAEVRTIDVMGPYEGGNTSWNINFRSAANNTGGMDLFFIGGHDSYDTAIIPGDDFSPDDTPTSYFRFDDDHPIAMIVGCHGGIPVPDIDVPGGADHSLVYDLIHEGAKAYIGATGFSYGSPGDLHRCLFGERLMQHFFHHLLRPPGSNSMTVGKALAEAKQDYVFGFGTNDALDRKTVTEFNLYGVPWTFIFYPGAMMRSREAIDIAMEQPEDSPFNTLARSIERFADEKVYTRTFEVNIDSYEVQTEVQDYITYHSFSIKNGEVAVAPKSPILPYIKAFTLPLPYEANVIEVKIFETDSTAIGKYNIPIAEVKPFSEGGLIYTTQTDIDYLYPSDENLVQYQKKSSNELLFTVFPIQHNPSTNETIFYKHFEVMVTYESPLNVTVTEFTTNKEEYLPGEQFDTISRIANVGDVDAVLTATLSVIDMLGETLGTSTSNKFTVPSGQSYNLPLSWTGMLGDGEYKLQITLFSDNSPVGGASADISVTGGKITDMKVPNTILPDEEGIFEITVANYRPVNVKGQVSLTIQESESGFVVDLPPKNIDIPGGSSRTVTFTWLPSDLWEGVYTVVATVIVDNQKYGPVSESFYMGTHENTPPVANAGPDKTLFANKDCLAQIQLDGAGSYDPDGDPLTYKWTWTGGSANGINPVVTLHPGVSTITLTVSDGLANDTDSVIIKVIDSTPPEITCPPDITTDQTSEDGTQVDLGAPIVSDNCDTSPTITNNAPALFPQGETIVTWTVTDSSGNSSSCTQTVNVLKPVGPCMFTSAITAIGQFIPGAESVSTVYIGIKPIAENYPSPGPLPDYTVYMVLSEGLLEDYRKAGSEYEEWHLIVLVEDKANANLPGFFPKLVWDSNDFCPPDLNTGYLKLYGEDAQGRRDLLVNDMYQTTQYQTREEDGQCIFTLNKCIFHYYIVWSKEMTFEMHLPAGWSMVSFPIFPPTQSVLDLFPEVVVVYGYKKGVGYIRSQTLEAGRGYWFLINEAQTYTLTGQPIQKYTAIVYGDGWEMIGGCTYPAKATTDGCNIDVIYRYLPGAGYRRVLASENIEPGRGYWMLLSNIKDRCEYRIETVAP